jgi:hypothetical protein
MWWSSNPAAELVGQGDWWAPVTELHDRKQLPGAEGREPLAPQARDREQHGPVPGAGDRGAAASLPYGFIDRVLVTAEAYRIPPSDHLQQSGRPTPMTEFGLLAEYEDVYQGAGYRTLITSALKGTVGRWTLVKELLRQGLACWLDTAALGRAPWSMRSIRRWTCTRGRSARRRRKGSTPPRRRRCSKCSRESGSLSVVRACVGESRSIITIHQPTTPNPPSSSTPPA